MNELFERFPELIKSLLERVEQLSSGESNKNIKMARSKLLSQLRNVMDEISQLQHKEPTQLTEKQMKKLAEMPRTLPSFMKWNIKPRKKSGGDQED